MRSMRFFARVLTAFLVSMAVYATNIPIGDDSLFITPTASNEIKIMSYNVLNLFDTEKDMFSDDWVWLPKNYPGKQKYCKTIRDPREQDFCYKLDWTPANLQKKLEQITKVVKFQGSLPDMLAVVEIENENVIKQLAKTIGYTNWKVTDSGTRRGVDVALLFNLKPGLTFVGAEAINTTTDSRHVGRDILRVDFNWNGKPFSIYVNHWVSQGGPVEARIANANSLRGDIEKQIQLAGSAGFSYLSVGDYNTTEEESPNAFDDVMHDQTWAQHSIDLEKIARKDLSNESLKYSPPGTYYYSGTDKWQKFDRIIGSADLIDGQGIELVTNSYRILFPKFMSYSRGANSVEDNIPDGFIPFDYQAEKENRVPLRYDFFTNDDSRRGFSDHLPVLFKIKQ